MSANSPIYRVIGVGWGLSAYLLLRKNFKVYLILVKVSTGNLLEIIPADLLETLILLLFSVICCCYNVTIHCSCVESRGVVVCGLAEWWCVGLDR